MKELEVMSKRGMIFGFAAAVLAAMVALIFGASVSTLLFVGVSLLCPAAMFFGMHSHGSAHSCGNNTANAPKRDVDPTNAISRSDAA